VLKSRWKVPFFSLRLIQPEISGRSFVSFGISAVPSSSWRFPICACSTSISAA